MPPKIKLTKEEILNAALDIIRESGAEALNARALAARLSASTQPIFSNFSGMDELKNEVIKVAYEIYRRNTEREMRSDEFPAYKASGMAYIRFAKDEPELFKLLFMCDRKGEGKNWDEMTENTVITIIMSNLDISREDAELFHLEMWSHTHGIAVMFATSYLRLDLELVSRMMSDVYVGIANLYKERKK